MPRCDVTDDVIVYVIMYRTWILKFPSFDFGPLVIFLTETEIETWLCQEDVSWATDYDYIYFHAVPYKSDVKRRNTLARLYQ